tara:strand:+ start:865 stop:1059 length:195 start_codon:yes stop_codon:yes gene_type:complete
MKKVSTLSIFAASLLSCNPMTTTEQLDGGTAADSGQETSYVFDAEEIKLASKINPQVKKIYISQ